MRDGVGGVVALGGEGVVEGDAEDRLLMLFLDPARAAVPQLRTRHLLR